MSSLIEMTPLKEVEMSPTSQYMEGVAARGFNRTRMRRLKSKVTFASEVEGRLVNKRSGKLLTSHEGRLRQGSLYTKDFFHSILSASWTKVLLLFGTTYALSWLFWACMWYSYNQLDKFYHNRHVNMTGNGSVVVSGTCVDKLEKFNSAMEFAIETSSTIGYGNIYVDPTCHIGVLFLIFQELLARLIDCFWIGLVFLKLARPEKRMNTMRFSKRSAISVLDGEQRLMFRIGDLNPGLNWASTELKLYMFYDGMTKEGVHSSFRQVRLDLDVDSVLFVLPLVVSHIITDDSPLWGMTQKEMATKKVEFILVFEGVVEATGNTLHARTSYVNKEIRWGQFFAEVNFRDEKGEARVDWTLFDETIPCATFNLPTHALCINLPAFLIVMVLVDAALSFVPLSVFKNDLHAFQWLAKYCSSKDTTMYDGNRLGYRKQDVIYEDNEMQSASTQPNVETNLDFLEFLPSAARGDSSTPNKAAALPAAGYQRPPARSSSGMDGGGQHAEAAPNRAAERSGSTSSRGSTSSNIFRSGSASNIAIKRSSGGGRSSKKDDSKRLSVGPANGFGDSSDDEDAPLLN